MMMDFLKVYGILIVCAAFILALAATLYSCITKIRRLENEIRSMHEDINRKLDEIAEQAMEDQKKQRRLLNEGLSGLTESVTRAVFSLKNERE